VDVIVMRNKTKTQKLLLWQRQRLDQPLRVGVEIRIAPMAWLR
jgi:hypothetical protein